MPEHQRRMEPSACSRSSAISRAAILSPAAQLPASAPAAGAHAAHQEGSPRRPAARQPQACAARAHVEPQGTEGQEGQATPSANHGRPHDPTHRRSHRSLRQDQRRRSPAWHGQDRHFARPSPLGEKGSRSRVQAVYPTTASGEELITKDNLPQATLRSEGFLPRIKPHSRMSGDGKYDPGAGSRRSEAGRRLPAGVTTLRDEMDHDVGTSSLEGVVNALSGWQALLEGVPGWQTILVRTRPRPSTPPSRASIPPASCRPTSRPQHNSRLTTGREVFDFHAGRLAPTSPSPTNQPRHPKTSRGAARACRRTVTVANHLHPGQPFFGWPPRTPRVGSPTRSPGSAHRFSSAQGSSRNAPRCLDHGPHHGTSRRSRIRWCRRAALGDARAGARSAGSTSRTRAARARGHAHRERREASRHQSLRSHGSSRAARSDAARAKIRAMLEGL